jgi:hypothetical protein
MGEPFRSSDDSLRKLALETVGAPIPETLRAMVNESIPPQEDPEFYRGVASGILFTIHICSVIEDARVMQAVLMAAQIRAASLFMNTEGD